MNDSMPHHNDHDLDLIAALAEGRLSDPADAESLVRACPECADAYRAHIAVLEAVAAAPAPRLDELERRRLRTSVWNEIAAAPLPTTRPTRGTPWWYRLAPAAAMLVVVVGVGAVLFDSGGDSGADVTRADAMTEMAADGEQQQEAADETAALQSATTAASEDTFVAEQAPADTEVADGPAGIDMTSEDLEEAAAAFARRVSEGDTREPLTDKARECLQGDPELDGPFLASETVPVDGSPALFIAQGTLGQVSRVVVFDRANCDVLLTWEP